MKKTPAVIASSSTSHFVAHFIGLTAALAGLLFGLDIGVISGALAFIQKEFHVADSVIELIVSATLWGAVAGVLFSGTLSNFFGRKKTLLLSGFIFAFGSIACAISTSAEWLIGSRFLLGIAVGLASFIAPIYIAEISPKKIRGSMVSVYQLMITIGILLAFFSDTFFATTFSIGGEVGGHWRWMLGIIALPAGAMFLAMLFLPESPRWLFLKGFQERGKNVFRKLQLSEQEIVEEINGIQTNLEQKQSGFQILFKNVHFRRAIFLGVTLQVIQQLTGINIVFYYAPRILDLMGFTSNADQMWGTVLLGATNMLSTFFAIALVDKLGRRPIMYTGAIVMGLAMIAVGCLLHTNISNSLVLGYSAIAALMIFIVAFAVSSGPVTWIFCSEIFPLAGRDIGVTFSTSANWISNAIIGGTFLTLLGKLGGSGTFILCGSLEALFILFFFFFLPETKGVSLEEIESNLLSGVPLKKLGK